MKDEIKRSLAKTITWRVIATSSTILLVYLFTKDIKAALAVGGINMILKATLYFLHERSWNRSTWGKHPKKK